MYGLTADVPPHLVQREPGELVRPVPGRLPGDRVKPGPNAFRRHASLMGAEPDKGAFEGGNVIVGAVPLKPRGDDAPRPLVPPAQAPLAADDVKSPAFRGRRTKMSASRLISPQAV